MQNASSSPAVSRSFWSHGMAKWGAFIVFLFTLWFGGWFAFAHYLDGQISSGIERAKSRGIEVTCDGQNVVGFPFRIGLACDNTKVKLAGGALSAEAGKLHTTAVVHDPTRIIGELSAPLIVKRGRAELLGEWETMRLFANGDLSGGFERISLNTNAFKWSTGDGHFAMDEGAFHTRPNPENGQALDVAFNTKGLAATPAPGLTIPPANISFDGRLDEGYLRLVQQRAPLGLMLSQGAKGELRSLILETGDGGRLALSGPIEWHGDGTISAEVSIGVENPDAVGQWVATINPRFQQGVAGIGQAVAGMGQKAQFGAVEIPAVTLTIKRNEVSLGFLKLMTLPRFDR